MREDGRLLAIRRADKGAWELPGGVLDLTEAPEAGVAREVLEETGIHVEVDQLTGVYKNTTRGIVALVFRCNPSGGSERTSEGPSCDCRPVRGAGGELSSRLLPTQASHSRPGLWGPGRSSSRALRLGPRSLPRYHSVWVGGRRDDSRGAA